LSQIQLLILENNFFLEFLDEKLIQFIINHQIFDCYNDTFVQSVFDVCQFLAGFMTWIAIKKVYKSVQQKEFTNYLGREGGLVLWHCSVNSQTKFWCHFDKDGVRKKRLRNLFLRTPSLPNNNNNDYNNTFLVQTFLFFGERSWSQENFVLFLFLSSSWKSSSFIICNVFFPY